MSKEASVFDMAIRAFTEGNGRTGRVLNLLMLVEQDLPDQPVLYLSRYIIERKADYYRLLRDFAFLRALEGTRSSAGAFSVERLRFP